MAFGFSLSWVPIHIPAGSVWFGLPKFLMWIQFGYSPVHQPLPHLVHVMGHYQELAFFVTNLRTIKLF
jgi:hypothetical protein